MNTPIANAGDKAIVLVMDDDPHIRSILEKMLTRFGYQVETTRDGSEALTRYQALMNAGRVPGAVILDLTVPGGMGGSEASERLLALDPEARIIVSSGDLGSPMASDLQEKGLKGALAKPFQLATLKETIQSILEK